MKLQIAGFALNKSNGNVKAALILLEKWGFGMSSSGLYTYRKKLEARDVGSPDESPDSKKDGIPAGMHIVRTRRKSGEHSG